MLRNIHYALVVMSIVVSFNACDTQRSDKLLTSSSSLRTISSVSLSSYSSEATVELLSKHYTKNYTELASVNVGNPDRGLYTTVHALNVRALSTYIDAKIAGYSLVYSPLKLLDYTDTPILDDAFLETLSYNLQQAKKANVKLILRITYRDSAEGNDPSASIVMQHLAQLKPIFQKYPEVISIVQMGIIGAWSEWHTFSGDYASSNVEYKKNRRDIIETLEEIFPTKFLQIRTPMHKEELFGKSNFYGEVSGNAKIDNTIAYTQKIEAKIGHHNDCFLASDTDFGTYSDTEVEFWKNYVKNDSMYAPVGGETCSVSAFSGCENALSELKAFHYSYLNDDYHPDILSTFKKEGCYQQIKENLGYRFVAESLNIEVSAKSFDASFSVINRGFASSYVKYRIVFSLYNENNRYDLETEEFDIRKLLAGQNKTFMLSKPLEKIEKGNYCLGMKISKDNSVVKLSNSNIWDRNLGLNILKCDIEL